MIEVVDAGFFTSIQDQGRHGYRHLGVPVSGPMDKKAFSMALALLPHAGDYNVWECTFIGPTLRLQKNTRFVVTGGEIDVKLNNTTVEMYRVYTAKSGSILSMGKIKSGVRAYLRFEAQLQLPHILGSSSFFASITPSSQIAKGDVFKGTVPNDLEENPVRLRFDSSYIDKKELEVVPGPDWKKLNPQDQNEITTQSFSVLAQNRMGYRLKGDVKVNASTLLSQLVLPGRVQLTPSGDLLIATSDCQVTGGYLQILQLTEDALATLSQKREGEQLTFQSILG